MHKKGVLCSRGPHESLRERKQRFAIPNQVKASMSPNVPPLRAAQDKCVGSLLGQALGDAAGLPVEGASVTAAAQAARSIRNGGFAQISGQYSDDTQLARELCLTLTNKGLFDARDYAERIKDLFVTNRVVGRGIATDNAARRIAQGTALSEAGEPPPSAGNGSAMRAAPIGMFHHASHDQEGLVRDAQAQGSITHQDERCSAGSVAVAAAVAEAIQGRHEEADGVRKLCRRSGELAFGIHEGAGAAFARVAELLDCPIAESREEIAGMLSADGKAPKGTDGNGIITPFVVPSVAWALFAAARSGGDPVEAAAICMDGGGDIDSTGAMAGAIAGAMGGERALPSFAPAALHDQGEWKGDALADLAREVCLRARGESN